MAEFSRKALAVILIGFFAITIIYAYASSIGPRDIAGFDWVNSTVGMDTPNVYVRGTNVTALSLYPQQPASYIIWRDGSTYYAKNGSTGAIDYNGVDAKTVINNVLSALTVGRTWKERVVLRGNFSISGTIYPRSYTVLDLTNARLIASTGISRVIELAGVTRTQVEIVGGIINANENNQGVHIESANQVLVRGTTIYDASDECFNIKSSNNVRISNCYAYSTISLADVDGFKIEDSTECTLSNNIAKNMGYGETPSTANGIELQGSTLCSVGGNIVVNSTSANINLEINSNDNVIDSNIVRYGKTTGILIAGSKRNTVSKNSVSDVTGQGINLYESSEAESRNTVIGNIVNNTGSYGIWVFNSNYNIINENQVSLTDAHAFLITDSDYNIISENQVERQSNNDIYIFQTSSYNLVQGNIIKILALSNTAQNNKIYDNIIKTSVTPGTGSNQWRANTGYVTENTGNATLAAITSSIVVNHGCSYTPTLGDIQVTANRDLGNCTYFWYDTVTATQFTIHVGASGAAKNIDKAVYFPWSVDRH